jgi:hypothetical protein
MELAALGGIREVSLSIADKVALEAVDGIRDVSLLFLLSFKLRKSAREQ